MAIHDHVAQGPEVQLGLDFLGIKGTEKSHDMRLILSLAVMALKLACIYHAVMKTPLLLSSAVIGTTFYINVAADQHFANGLKDLNNTVVTLIKNHPPKTPLEKSSRLIALVAFLVFSAYVSRSSLPAIFLGVWAGYALRHSVSMRSSEKE